VRLWLKDTERRPDPVPVRTDARKAYAVGTLAWLAVLVVLLVFARELLESGRGWWLWCAGLGLALGLGGLIWVGFRRR
jgi:hypothetical protein